MKQLKAYKGEDVIESDSSQDDFKKSGKGSSNEVKIIEVTEEKDDSAEEDDKKDSKNENKPPSESKLMLSNGFVVILD